MPVKNCNECDKPITEKKIRFRREDCYYIDALYFCSKKCLKKNLPRKCAECSELSPSNCHAIKIANKNIRLYFCDSDCFNSYCEKEKEKEKENDKNKSEKNRKNPKNI